MRTRESEEMYLETILLLKQKSANVHSVDVVGELNYAKSSVSRGMNLLVKNGYITMDRVTGVIEFTEKGRAKAQNIYERHRVLTKVLEKIGASAEMADENACRIETVMSYKMLHVITKFVTEGYFVYNKLLS